MSGAPVNLTVATKYETSVGTGQSGGRFDQRVENGLQIESRAADHLEHVGSSGLLLKRFAQLIETRTFSMAMTAWLAKFVSSSNLLVGEW